ncbi:MAG: lipoyl domain-containing protein [Candidatus Nanopelagicales bacterium]
MSEVINFPQLSSDDAAQGVVSTWLAHTGEQVSQGQVVAEVMVDKVAVDIEAPCAGVMTQLVEEEAAVIQGTPIAQID